MRARTKIEYEFTEQEVKDAQKFIDEHQECRDTYLQQCIESNIHEAIAPSLVSYNMGSCSVADSLSIQCDFCGEEEDISDVSVW